MKTASCIVTDQHNDRGHMSDWLDRTHALLGSINRSGRASIVPSITTKYGRCSRHSFYPFYSEHGIPSGILPAFRPSISYFQAHRFCRLSCAACAVFPLALEDGVGSATLQRCHFCFSSGACKSVHPSYGLRIMPPPPSSLLGQKHRDANS